MRKELEMRKMIVKMKTKLESTRKKKKRKYTE